MTIQNKKDLKYLNQEFLIATLDPIQIKCGVIQNENLLLKIPNSKSVQNFIASTYEGKVILINYYVKVKVLNKRLDLQGVLNKFCLCFYNNSCQVKT